MQRLRRKMLLNLLVLRFCLPLVILLSWTAARAQKLFVHKNILYITVASLPTPGTQIQSDAIPIIGTLGAMGWETQNRILILPSSLSPDASNISTNKCHKIYESIKKKYKEGITYGSKKPFLPQKKPTFCPTASSTRAKKEWKKAYLKQKGKLIYWRDLEGLSTLLSPGGPLHKQPRGDRPKLIVLHISSLRYDKNDVLWDIYRLSPALVQRWVDTLLKAFKVPIVLYLSIHKNVQGVFEKMTFSPKARVLSLIVGSKPGFTFNRGNICPYLSATVRRNCNKVIRVFAEGKIYYRHILFWVLAMNSARDVNKNGRDFVDVFRAMYRIQEDHKKYMLYHRQRGRVTFSLNGQSINKLSNLNQQAPSKNYVFIEQATKEVGLLETMEGKSASIGNRIPKPMFSKLEVELNNFYQGQIKVTKCKSKNSCKTRLLFKILYYSKPKGHQLCYIHTKKNWVKCSTQVFSNLSS